MRYDRTAVRWSLVLILGATLQAFAAIRPDGAATNAPPAPNASQAPEARRPPDNLRPPIHLWFPACLCPSRPPPWTPSREGVFTGYPWCSPSSGF